MLKLVRSCVICKKKEIKSNLIRIISNENLDAVYDENQKINSRGIYICRDKKCLEKVVKLIEKNKFNVKININKESLLELVKKIESELGE